MILARKISQIPESFIIFFSEKLTKFPNFTRFCPKMPEFYIIIARKIFFPNFRGGGYVGHVPLLPPVSYA